MERVVIRCVQGETLNSPVRGLSGYIPTCRCAWCLLTQGQEAGAVLAHCGPVGTWPQWMRHCSSCFAHKMGLIPCKPGGWAGEGGWEQCKTWAGDKHRVIPTF